MGLPRSRGIARGANGENSKAGTKRAERPYFPHSSSAFSRNTQGCDKTSDVAARRTNSLGFATACRPGAHDRSSLRGSLLTDRREDLPALRRDPRHGHSLSCARRGLAAAAETGHLIRERGRRADERVMEPSCSSSKRIRGLNRESLEMISPDHQAVLLLETVPQVPQNSPPGPRDRPRIARHVRRFAPMIGRTPPPMMAATDTFPGRGLAGLRRRFGDVIRFPWNGKRTLPL
jgi:hypothetical protein